MRPGRALPQDKAAPGSPSPPSSWGHRSMAPISSLQSSSANVYQRSSPSPETTSTLWVPIGLVCLRPSHTQVLCGEGTLPCPPLLPPWRDPRPPCPAHLCPFLPQRGPARRPWPPERDRGAPAPLTDRRAAEWSNRQWPMDTCVETAAASDVLGIVFVRFGACFTALAGLVGMFWFFSKCSPVHETRDIRHETAEIALLCLCIFHFSQHFGKFHVSRLDKGFQNFWLFVWKGGLLPVFFVWYLWVFVLPFLYP